MPIVSIIVPNYNHSQYLPQRFDSIFNQTFQDYEVIILDDCSTDNSVDVLAEYAKNLKVSHFIINNKNSGSPFRQWEKGLALAKGEYIWIAESDDYCSDRFLEQLFKVISKDTELGLVFSQSNKVDENNNIKENFISHTSEFSANIFLNDFKMKGKDFIEKYLIFKNVIPNASAVLFSKEKYEKINEIDTNIKYCGDWLFWLKIATISNVAFVAESLNSFRHHNNSALFLALNRTNFAKTFPVNYDLFLRVAFDKWITKNGFSLPQIKKENKKFIFGYTKQEVRWYIKNDLYFKAFFKTFVFYLKGLIRITR